jgi:RNA polymerase sigma-70 factor (ECF subfamily)
MSHSETHQSNFQSARGADDREFKIIDEEKLVKRVFDTDPKQGCEILFKKYYRLLCSHAVRFVYSKEVAEDIVGEIFCRFWSDQIYSSITTSYRAYLFKAVRFSAYNYIRWELSKRRNEVDLDQLLDQMQEFKPEETLMFDELAAVIGKSIDTLPTQCRKIFMLSRFENRKYREIADELRISVKAVEAQISKALEILRNKLKSGDLLSVALISCYLNS